METKFSSLSLSELKQELKKRNAKQSGRKKELIERLEAYERNCNFGNSERPLQPEYNMKVPDPMLYLDLNSDKKLPCITMEGIESYLNAFDKSMDPTPVGLYKEKHLCYLRVCFCDESESYFIKSTCRAEMKKSVTYGIDIRLSVVGEVQEAQCECGAGMGPTAHCKHVCTVLYAGCMFSKSGSVVVENTCTDKLQSFHRVKKHTGSPVKTCDLQLDGADESTNINFDPRPTKFRKCEGYSDYFRNTCLNFKGVSNMPVFQLFEPVNLRGYAHDHDYLSKTQEECFLESVGLVNLTKEKFINIEKRTRGQNRNVVWQEERGKRLQSSNFGRICKVTERTDLSKLARELVTPKSFRSKATDHGIKYEKEAIRRYEQVHKCTVKDCGIFVSNSIPFLGSSPDGIICKDIILEVKCPFSARDKLITPQTVPYMKATENGIQLDTKHNYYYQIQGQLFCTGAKYCDFLVYTLVDEKCLRIERDDDFISTMIEKLQKFYDEFFEPALLQKHFYKECL